MRRERRATERGASAVEYALLIALVAAAIASVVLVLGPNVADLYRAAGSW